MHYVAITSVRPSVYPSVNRFHMPYILQFSLSLPMNCNRFLLWLHSALLSLGRFFSFLIYTQLVELLGQGFSPSQGHYLYTERHKHRINCTQTSMPRVWFEPRIPVFERAKTVNASDRAATVIVDPLQSLHKIKLQSDFTNITKSAHST
jgi:hypothetical protein